MQPLNGQVMKTFIHRRPSIGSERHQSPQQIGVEVPVERPEFKAFRAISAQAISVGALAIGALSIGAVAFGTIAVGRMVIGRFFARKGRIDQLEIGCLKIGSLEVSEPLKLNEPDRSPVT
jgi:nitric oxide synthase oxygenase domain/subunit